MRLVANTIQAFEGAPADAQARFALEMAQRPVAEHTAAANLGPPC